MVVTILQAAVDPARAPELVRAYREGVADLEPGIVETFLLQDARDDAQWQIVTVWSSREALEEMRATGRTPRGVEFFQAAGAAPALTVLGVVEHAAEPTA
jgi:quinol monooxygenase YgiN